MSNQKFDKKLLLTLTMTSIRPFLSAYVNGNDKYSTFFIILMALGPFGFCDTDVIFYVYVYVLPLLSSKHKNQRILTILIICYVR